MATTNIQTEALSPKGAKLYRIAGWGLFSLCVLHGIFFIIISLPSWSGWVAGGLWKVPPRGLEEITLQHHFWGFLGSFMVPLALVSLIWVWAAGQRIKLPAFISWAAAVWLLMCSLLIPGAFILGAALCLLPLRADKTE